MNAVYRNTVERYAREQMSKLGIHGWTHVKRVQRLCLKLSSEMKGVDSEVVEIAALLHDVGKYAERENNAVDHGSFSADMAEKFLNSIKFNRDRVAAVCHAIRAHTHRAEPDSLEAKILHDADFLDKMGTVGVATLFIRACLTGTTIEETSEFWRNPSRESFVGLHALWLQKPHFYTKIAKDLARKRNKIVDIFFEQLKREIELTDA
jgi:uncharacterized protein